MYPGHKGPWSGCETYIHELKASGFGDVKAGVTGQEALNDDEMNTAMAGHDQSDLGINAGCPADHGPVSSRLSPSADNPHISCRGPVLDFWMDGFIHRSFEYPFDCFCADALRSGSRLRDPLVCQIRRGKGPVRRKSPGCYQKSHGASRAPELCWRA